MCTLVQLRTGEYMCVASNNTEKKTMHLYPIAEMRTFNPEWDTAVEYSYADIKGEAGYWETISQPAPSKTITQTL